MHRKSYFAHLRVIFSLLESFPVFHQDSFLPQAHPFLFVSLGLLLSFKFPDSCSNMAWFENMTRLIPLGRWDPPDSLAASGWKIGRFGPLSLALKSPFTRHPHHHHLQALQPCKQKIKLDHLICCKKHVQTALTNQPRSDVTDVIIEFYWCLSMPSPSSWEGELHPHQSRRRSALFLWGGFAHPEIDAT